MNVFIDTSIFAGQQYNFNSYIFKSFIQAAKDKSIKILLPDPIEREIVRHLKDRSSDAVDSLISMPHKTPFLRQWSKFSDYESREEETTSLFNVAHAQLLLFIEEFEVIRLNYEGIDIEKVMDWYDNGDPPFGRGSKRKEFPDAFAFSILLKYANDNDEKIYVISNDTDFSKACESQQCLIYLSDLADATEILIKDIDTVTKVKTYLSSHSKEFKKHILETASAIKFCPKEINIGINKSTINSLKILNISVIDLKDKICTIKFNAEVDSSHRFKWRTLDYYNYIEEGEFRELFKISGRANVELYKDNRTVNKIISVELDSNELILEKLPENFSYTDFYNPK